MRMSKKAEPSLANKKLNKEIEKSAQWNKVRKDDLEQQQTDLGSESNLGTRDMTKGQGKSTRISTSNVKLSEKRGSNFTVLEDISEESDILESIEILKQKIRNIPRPNTKGGQAHEKGKK